MTDVPVPASGRDAPPLAGGGGFAIEVRHVFDHPPVRTFRIFVDRINEWWDQRLHPEARTVLEAVPGGDFKQLWSSGGAFLATVAQVDAPYRLRLVGPLAIARPAHSVVELTFEPTPDGQGTVLVLHHECIGAVSPETGATYERSWQDLIGRAFADRLRAG